MELSATQALFEHGIDIMKLNDDFNCQLLAAMERYKEQALKSLSIEKERDELKAERDRYREALQVITQVKYNSLDLGESWYDRLTDATTIARTALAPIEQVKP